MNGEYQLVIDTWEGQLEIDENVLLSNGVAGMIIRLNDMNGGHHMDENFLTQWEQAKAFCRAPYFVYNPWLNGFSNYIWLASHMPSDAKAVLLDVEVRMSGYPPATYTTEVRKFHDLVRAKWTTAIYTGEWFLSALSSWPTDADYWWAQYPLEFYQDQDIHLTWDELRTRLQKYDKPFNASKIPGRLRMWQLSGDTLILPGNPRIMDVNVFYGSRADLESWLGPAGPANGQPPDDNGGTMNGTAKEKLGNISKVRNAPSRYGREMGQIAAYSTIEFVEIVPVTMLGSADAISDKWLKLPNGNYVNYLLAGKLYYTILTQPTTDPEPEPEPGLPATWEHTLVAKDAGGNILATYKGTLAKQP